jgi:hypothetical protein
MKSQLNELQKTAIHEAGHAVLYYIFDNPLDSISANESGEGCTKPYNSYLPTAYATSHTIGLEQNLLEYGIICFGGYFSEFKVQRKQFDIFSIADVYKKSQHEYANNDFGDIREQMKIANTIKGSKLFDFDFFQMIGRRTTKLLSKKDVWNAVLMLSDALMHSEKGYLNGEQIHRILDDFDLVNKYKVNIKGVYSNKERHLFSSIILQ